MSEKEAQAPSHEAEAMIRRLLLSRNGPAVHEVARRHGLSRPALEAILNHVLDEQRRVGTKDRLGPTYDIRTGRYLTLEELVAQLIRSYR